MVQPDKGNPSAKQTMIFQPLGEFLRGGGDTLGDIGGTCKKQKQQAEIGNNGLG